MIKNLCKEPDVSTFAVQPDNILSDENIDSDNYTIDEMDLFTQTAPDFADKSCQVAIKIKVIFLHFRVESTT